MSKKGFRSDDPIIVPPQQENMIEKTPVVFTGVEAQLEQKGGCPFIGKSDITCTYPDCGCHEKDD